MKRLLVVGAALVLTGCAAGVGAGAGALLIGVGIATHECYQYTDITVIDGVTGFKTCDADVSVIQDGEAETLGSCYHAPLTAGRWTLRAELPGRKAAVTSFVVKEHEGCATVSTVVLTIPAPGAATGPQPLQPAPSPPAAAPPPAPPLETAPPPPPSAPPASSETPPAAPAPPPSAAPTPEVPPTQRFPD
ncbi:MAG TPA: hypothetical protein VM686_20220 [Polyangiaceae bacterium]|nr:hypothetical protein [Polyangiaceae bacterium]